MREEQPMPEITAMSSGGVPSSASDLVSDIRTWKSPQPGHQTGSISER